MNWKTLKGEGIELNHAVIPPLNHQLPNQRMWGSKKKSKKNQKSGEKRKNEMKSKSFDIFYVEGQSSASPSLPLPEQLKMSGTSN